jgi:hypothetical protein
VGRSTLVTGGIYTADIMNSITAPDSDSILRKVMPRNSQRYSAGTSALRCMGALLIGALVTGLFLVALDQHYRPIRLPAAPTVRASAPSSSQGRAILYESLADAVLHKSLDNGSSSGSSVFATQATPQPVEAESP